MNGNGKLLFIFNVNTTLQQGDSTHVREFLQNLQKRNVNFDTVTPDGADCTRRGKSSKLSSFINFRRRAIRSILKRKYQKVYMRYFTGLFIELIILKLLGKKVIVELNAVVSEESEETKRSIWIRISRRVDEYFIFLCSSVVIAVTPEIKAYYHARYKKDIIAVVSNGVNTSLFNPANPGRIDNFPEGAKDVFYVGYVGSLYAWQDVETMVMGLHILINEKHMEDVKGIIVGDGSEASKIVDLIHKHNLDSHIIMTGRVSYEDIPRYIKLFAVGVAPFKGSRSKNTGSSALKVFEYLAMNTPVIISEVGSLSNFIREKNLGYVYRSGDHVDLAQKILDMYSATKDGSSILIGGRQLIEAEYSWGIAAQKVLHAIGKVD